jgi:hypothetical protein
MQNTKKRKSAVELLEQAKRLAYKQQNVPFAPPKKQKTGPLVPVYIGLDSQSGEFREQLLWKVDEKEITPAAAAARLCHELCLPPAQFEKFIEQQIEVGIKHYKNWKRTGVERVVKLKVAVKRGNQLLRDIVLWDLSNPHNTAPLYASVTCRDLALDHAWYEALQHKVQQLIDDVRYELAHFPAEVQLEQPDSKRLPDEAGFPRLDPFDAALDWDMQYQQKRKEKMKLPGRQYPEPRHKEHIPPDVSTASWCDAGVMRSSPTACWLLLVSHAWLMLCLSTCICMLPGRLACLICSVAARLQHITCRHRLMASCCVMRCAGAHAGARPAQAG